ncbi:hypothetical protein PQX77_003279, partial [Marasmius sp. AFHP31]
DTSDSPPPAQVKTGMLTNPTVKKKGPKAATASEAGKLEPIPNSALLTSPTTPQAIVQWDSLNASSMV